MKSMQKVLILFAAALALTAIAACSSPTLLPPSNDTGQPDTNPGTDTVDTSDTGVEDEDTTPLPDTTPACVPATSCTTHEQCCAGNICNFEDRKCEPAFMDENGVTADTITLGMTADFAGPVKDVGLAFKQGMEAYFHQVNEVRNGVHGRKIELFAANDNYDPAVALQNVKDMIGDGTDREVLAIIGAQGAPNAAQTAPWANSHNTIFFGPFSGGASTRNNPPDRYVFNVRTSFKQETFAIVDYMTTLQEPPVPAVNVALFAQASDAEGTLDELGGAGFEGVSAAVKPAGVLSDDVPVFTYVRGTINANAAAEAFVEWLGQEGKVLYPHPEMPGMNFALILVVLTAQGTPAAEFEMAVMDDLLAMQNMQPSSYITIDDFAADPMAPTQEEMDAMQAAMMRAASSMVIFSATSSVGDELANYLKVRDPAKYCTNFILSQVVPYFGAGSTGVTNYREQLDNFAPGANPGHVSLEGYLTARMFVEALEVAGPDLTDDVLVDAIESLESVNLGIGVNFGFSPNKHEASDHVWGTFLDENCGVQQHPYHSGSE